MKNQIKKGRTEETFSINVVIQNEREEGVEGEDREHEGKLRKRKQLKRNDAKV